MNFGRQLTILSAVVAFGLTLLPAGTKAQAQSCDRPCLGALGDRLLNSMVAHDPGALPLSSEYAATENGVAAALPMMNLWRTITGIKSRYYVVDPVTHQLFFIVTAAEGPHDNLLFGRFKVDRDAKLSELEFYIDRSRGDAGFQFGLQDGPMAFPTTAWQVSLKKSQRESRAALLNVGRSIFDRKISSPPVAAGCKMMENGKFSDENPKVLRFLMPSNLSMAGLKRNGKGLDLVPCAAPPERPHDDHARTDIVDEQDGIVVSFGMISGLIQPYLVTSPTDSAFVPFDIMQPYVNLLKAQNKSGEFTAPRLRAMPVTSVVAHLYRMYDGKVQGMLLLFNVEPYRSTSPWVAAR